MSPKQHIIIATDLLKTCQACAMYTSGQHLIFLEACRKVRLHDYDHYAPVILCSTIGLELDTYDSSDE